MGLDNRDYLRDESSRYSGGSSFGADAPMCRKLLIATIVVFLLQIFSMRDWTQEELAKQRDRLIASHRQFLADNPHLQAEDPDSQADAERLIQSLQDAERLTPQMLGLRDKQVSAVQSWLQLETPKVFTGQVWRLITCAFCHDRKNIGHIFFNMLLLWIFGRRLESMYGSKEFLLFYLAAAVVASVCYMAIDLVSGDPTAMIGASGAIMALVTLYAVHFPTQTIYVMFIIPVEIRWLVLFYAIYDLHPLLLQASGEQMNDSVAHAAHLGGLAFGYYYAKRQFRLFPLWSRLETWWKARRRGLRVVGDAPAAGRSARSQQLADEMDAILKKISEQGEGSLTNAERKTLERASRELRNRRQ